jgi:hypothetical protein
MLEVGGWLLEDGAGVGRLLAAVPLGEVGINLDIVGPTEHGAQAKIPVPLDLDR